MVDKKKPAQHRKKDNMDNGNENYKITSVDLVETRCDMCDEINYPSVLISVKNRWKYKYVCENCLAKRNIVGKKELRKKRDNIMKNKVINSFIDNSWQEEPEIKGLIELFEKIEDDDRRLGNIDHIGLRKVHDYLNGEKTGIFTYTRDELVEYFNFYGNDNETVITLQRLLINNPSNHFIKETYIDARTKKLSKEQMDALKRSKDFPFLRKSNEFWDKAEELSNHLHILLENTPNEEISKASNIVDDVLDQGYYTTSQKNAIISYRNKYGI